MMPHFVLPPLRSVTFHPASGILALVDVVLEPGLGLSGLQLVQGAYGPFVLLPRAASTASGDPVRLHPSALRELSGQILSEWEERAIVAAGRTDRVAA